MSPRELSWALIVSDPKGNRKWSIIKFFFSQFHRCSLFPINWSAYRCCTTPVSNVLSKHILPQWVPRKSKPSKWFLKLAIILLSRYSWTTGAGRTKRWFMIHKNISTHNFACPFPLIFETFPFSLARSRNNPKNKIKNIIKIGPEGLKLWWARHRTRV